MSSVRLPIQLKSQPIIDVVFELRVPATSQLLAAVVPGALAVQFKDQSPKIERLPASMVPDAFRSADPNLAFQGLVKVTVGKFNYVVGDQSVAIGCGAPYPGWGVFKEKIVEFLGLLNGLGAISNLSRHSLKYIDFLVGDDLVALRKLVAMEMTFGSKRISSESTNIQIQSSENGFVKLLSFVAPAQVHFPGQVPKSGLIMDIDLVRQEDTTLEHLLSSNGSALDQIHQESKATFFDLLTPHALDVLGATYDD
jgi:uncharacterized protein (TIGR04255 family)